MPRRLRLYIPGIPTHVVQRGNNREPCFFSEDDFYFYLETLAKGLKRYEVSCHAYVLMTNHVHLLFTPTTRKGISQLMAYLGKVYVAYINKTYRRTGTLWEGRHKSSLVDTETYLLRCYRYIEMNPVRARMVSRPNDYAWSSYRRNGEGWPSEVLTEHVLYTSLGHDAAQRQHRYRALFRLELLDEEIQAIRHATYFNYVMGSEEFRKSVEQRLGRKIGYDKTGRPRLTV